MKISELNANTVLIAVMLGAGAYALRTIIKNREKFNPASDRNAIYQGANNLVRMLPGTSRDETLGTWIWGIVNDDPFEDDPTIVGSEAWKERNSYTARPGASGSW
jgi:hypothetical protein